MPDAVDDVLADLLVCPDGHGRLRLESGEWTCAQCGRLGVEQGGIARFVEQAHLESFGTQWNRFDVVRDDEDRRVLEVKTGVKLDELSGLRVLDAGCGGGRYSRLAAMAGARVVGADHSSAVEKASEVCRDLPRADFLQADLKRLPLEPGSFDLVFSIGVMHHDRETRAVFDEVSKMVCPGGRMAVWLYRRNTWWQEWLNERMRRRALAMSPERLERWCRRLSWWGGVPVLNKLLNKLINFSNHPDAELRMCDTYDWYAPTYQHHHTVAELREWFESAGFGDLRELPPEKAGVLYRWAWRSNLIPGSGVNVVGTRLPE
jgi:SAM-dependent methyltransferase